MKKLIPLLLLSTNLCFAEDYLRVQIGKDKDSSVSDLRERVTQLERAVNQLQLKVIDLERGANLSIKQPEKKWTCRISSFGKTYTKTAGTKGEAKAGVMEDCSRGSSSIHCGDDEVKCED